MFKLSKEEYKKKKYAYRNTYIGSRMFVGMFISYLAFIVFLLWTFYSLIVLKSGETGAVLKSMDIPMAVITGFGTLLSMVSFILLVETDFKIFKDYVDKK